MFFAVAGVVAIYAIANGDYKDSKWPLAITGIILLGVVL